MCVWWTYRCCKMHVLQHWGEESNLELDRVSSYSVTCAKSRVVEIAPVASRVHCVISVHASGAHDLAQTTYLEPQLIRNARLILQSQTRILMKSGKTGASDAVMMMWQISQNMQLTRSCHDGLLPCQVICELPSVLPNVTDTEAENLGIFLLDVFRVLERWRSTQQVIRNWKHHSWVLK